MDTPSAAKGSIKAGAPKSPGPQMAMGRIKHTLLDEGRSSSPTDLRPSPATPPYHTKLRMFLSKTKGWSPTAQSKGRVVQPGRGEQRGQQHPHYKGRDTPKDTPALVILVAACLIGTGQNEGSKPGSWKLRPCDRSRCDEHGRVVTVRHVACARPTGDSHGRTTRAPAQRRGGAKRRPRCVCGNGCSDQRGQQYKHYKGRSQVD